MKHSFIVRHLPWGQAHRRADTHTLLVSRSLHEKKNTSDLVCQLTIPICMLFGCCSCVLHSVENIKPPSPIFLVEIPLAQRSTPKNFSPLLIVVVQVHEEQEKEKKTNKSV